MVSASNACIPVNAPVTAQVPPLPNTTRGEPCPLDGDGGRLNSGRSLLAYPSGKLCVVRSLKEVVGGGETEETSSLPNSKLGSLVYRVHQFATSVVKMSTSGAYVASGDVRGKLRVWALDHEEHLVKLDTTGLSSAVRAVAWDGESKRLAFAGDRLDNSSVCTRAVQWDTANSQGNLYQHQKGQSCAVAFKPNRPFRVVTGGREDGKLHFHKGPPFQKMSPDGTTGAPCEDAHGRGVNSVRYRSDGSLVASVGGDKSVCIYDGTTLALLTKMDGVHAGTIYACDWSGDGRYLLTASADGTCKLLEVSPDGTSIDVKRTWDVAAFQLGAPCEKAPQGGMQLGCAFVGGGTPVSVSTNNQLAVLPMPESDGDGGTIRMITGHCAPIGAVAFDHANKVFYTGDSDGIIVRWDLERIEALERVVPEDNGDLMYAIHKGAINGMTVLKEDDARLVSVAWDDTAMYTKGGRPQEGKRPLDITAQPTSIHTGTRLTAILTVDGVLLLRDGERVSSGLCPIGSYDGNVVCVSKDDKKVYVGGNDHRIHVYDVVAASGGGGEELVEVHVIADGHLKPVHSLALSNDGTKLAAGDVRDVCVYDVSSSDYSKIVGKSKWCFHLQRITTIAWSPDDRIIATGGSDDSVYLWSLDKPNKRLQYPFAHRGGIVSLAFLREEEEGGALRLVSVGGDSCVVRWDFTADAAAKFQ